MKKSPLKRKPFKKKKVSEKTLRKRLFSKAWFWFSLYIKARDRWTCCTCGKDLSENRSQCHAGHYKHGVLDFDEINVNAQCSGCNTYRNGNLTSYALFLTRKYGPDILEKLEAAASEQRARPKKYTVEELEAIIAEYGVSPDGESGK